MYLKAAIFKPELPRTRGNRTRDRGIAKAGAQTTRRLPKAVSRARILHGATARALRHAQSPQSPSNGHQRHANKRIPGHKISQARVSAGLSCFFIHQWSTICPAVAAFDGKPSLPQQLAKKVISTRSNTYTKLSKSMTRIWMTCEQALALLLSCSGHLRRQAPLGQGSLRRKQFLAHPCPGSCQSVPRDTGHSSLKRILPCALCCRLRRLKCPAVYTYLNLSIYLSVYPS